MLPSSSRSYQTQNNALDEISLDLNPPPNYSDNTFLQNTSDNQISTTSRMQNLQLPLYHPRLSLQSNVVLESSDLNFNLQPNNRTASKRGRKSLTKFKEPKFSRKRFFFNDSSDDLDFQRFYNSNSKTKKSMLLALDIIRNSIEEGNLIVDLSELGMKEIPEEIVELEHLVVLESSGSLSTDLKVYLNENKFMKIPKPILQLSNLTILILSNNRLDEIPTEIANLVNLKELSITGNKIKCLPSEIFKLKKLERLFLRPNPFLEAPRPLFGSNPPSNYKDLNDIHDIKDCVLLDGINNIILNQTISGSPPSCLESPILLPSLFDLAARSAYTNGVNTNNFNLQFINSHFWYDKSYLNSYLNYRNLMKSSHLSDTLYFGDSESNFEQYMRIFKSNSLSNMCPVCNSKYLLPSVKVIVWCYTSWTQVERLRAAALASMNVKAKSESQDSFNDSESNEQSLLKRKRNYSNPNDRKAENSENEKEDGEIIESDEIYSVNSNSLKLAKNYFRNAALRSIKNGPSNLSKKQKTLDRNPNLKNIEKQPSPKFKSNNSKFKPFLESETGESGELSESLTTSDYSSSTESSKDTDSDSSDNENSTKDMPQDRSKSPYKDYRSDSSKNFSRENSFSILRSHKTRFKNSKNLEISEFSESEQDMDTESDHISEQEKVTNSILKKSESEKLDDSLHTRPILSNNQPNISKISLGKLQGIKPQLLDKSKIALKQGAFSFVDKSLHNRNNLIIDLTDNESDSSVSSSDTISREENKEIFDISANSFDPQKSPKDLLSNAQNPTKIKNTEKKESRNLIKEYHMLLSKRSGTNINNIPSSLSNLTIEDHKNSKKADQDTLIMNNNSLVPQSLDDKTLSQNVGFQLMSREKRLAELKMEYEKRLRLIENQNSSRLSSPANSTTNLFINDKVDNKNEPSLDNTSIIETKSKNLIISMEIETNKTSLLKQTPESVLLQHNTLEPSMTPTNPHSKTETENNSTLIKESQKVSFMNYNFKNQIATISNSNRTIVKQDQIKSVRETIILAMKQKQQLINQVNKMNLEIQKIETEINNNLQKLKTLNTEAKKISLIQEKSLSIHNSNNVLNNNKPKLSSEAVQPDSSFPEDSLINIHTLIGFLEFLREKITTLKNHTFTRNKEGKKKLNFFNKLDYVNGCPLFTPENFIVSPITLAVGVKDEKPIKMVKKDSYYIPNKNTYKPYSTPITSNLRSLLLGKIPQAGLNNHANIRTSLSKKFCIYEASGGYCNDDECRSSHSKDFEQNTVKLLSYLLIRYPMYSQHEKSLDHIIELEKIFKMLLNSNLKLKATAALEILKTHWKESVNKENFINFTSLAQLFLDHNNFSNFEPNVKKDYMTELLAEYEQFLYERLSLDENSINDEISCWNEKFNKPFFKEEIKETNPTRSWKIPVLSSLKNIFAQCLMEMNSKKPLANLNNSFSKNQSKNIRYWESDQQEKDDIDLNCECDTEIHKEVKEMLILSIKDNGLTNIEEAFENDSFKLVVESILTKFSESQNSCVELFDLCTELVMLLNIKTQNFEALIQKTKYPTKQSVLPKTDDDVSAEDSKEKLLIEISDSDSNSVILLNPNGGSGNNTPIDYVSKMERSYCKYLKKIRILFGYAKKYKDMETSITDIPSEIQLNQMSLYLLKISKTAATCLKCNKGNSDFGSVNIIILVWQMHWSFLEFLKARYNLGSVTQKPFDVESLNFKLSLGLLLWMKGLLASKSTRPFFVLMKKSPGKIISNYIKSIHAEKETSNQENQRMDLDDVEPSQLATEKIEVPSILLKIHNEKTLSLEKLLIFNLSHHYFTRSKDQNNAIFDLTLKDMFFLWQILFYSASHLEFYSNQETTNLFYGKLDVYQNYIKDKNELYFIEHGNNRVMKHLLNLTLNKVLLLHSQYQHSQILVPIIASLDFSTGSRLPNEEYNTENLEMNVYFKHKTKYPTILFPKRLFGLAKSFSISPQSSLTKILEHIFSESSKEKSNENDKLIYDYCNCLIFLFPMNFSVAAMVSNSLSNIQLETGRLSRFIIDTKLLKLFARSHSETVGKLEEFPSTIQHLLKSTVRRSKKNQTASEYNTKILSLFRDMCPPDSLFLGSTWFGQDSLILENDKENFSLREFYIKALGIQSEYEGFYTLDSHNISEFTLKCRESPVLWQSLAYLELSHLLDVEYKQKLKSMIKYYELCTYTLLNESSCDLFVADISHVFVWSDYLVFQILDNQQIRTSIFDQMLIFFKSSLKTYQFPNSAMFFTLNNFLLKPSLLWNISTSYLNFLLSNASISSEKYDIDSSILMELSINWACTSIEICLENTANKAQFAPQINYYRNIFKNLIVPLDSILCKNTNSKNM
ncbi:hypothetical protein BB559_003107 [Furculomyces boomerangus]|uniref:Putative zinc-finger domain-containing protein n=1 Tax=Furculomyces boomerangus TaxID=61424 RepID=A0A2T9YNT0_9FUNG|nr:hypothetical protein BB559_003107 [Furculomyces boomerangus]